MIKIGVLMRHLATACTGRLFYKFYGLYVLFLSVAAFFSVGWLQPDEHSRVLEVAHKFVYGFGTLPWEFDAPYPIVSQLLGTLYVPPLFVARLLSLNGLHSAALMRLWTVLFSSTGIIAFHWLLPLWGLRKERVGLYTALFALGPFTPLLLLRTSQENWSQLCFLWALYVLFQLCLVRYGETQILTTWKKFFRASPLRSPIPLSRGACILLGLLIALCASFRLQMGVAAAFVGLLAWRVVGIRRVGWIVTGVLIGLIPLAAVDLATTETPFSPAINYLNYALGDEEGGGLWGSRPWTYYLEGFLGFWYPPFSPILLLLIAIGLIANPTICFVLGPFALIHFCLGHKEFRYFSPQVPILYVATFVGTEWVTTWLYRRQNTGHENRVLESIVNGVSKCVSPYVLFAASFSVIAALVPLNPSPYLFQELNDRLDKDQLKKPIFYVANSRSNVLMFYFKHPDVVPQKLEIDDFLNRIHTKTVEEGTYAFYRLDAKDLPTVAAQCSVDFISSGELVRKIINSLGSLVRKNQIDAIATCPNSKTVH